MKRLLFFLVFPLLVLGAAMLLGPPGGPGALRILRWAWDATFASGRWPAPDDLLIRTILLEVRLPRVLLAFLVGSALASSGTALQALVRNPLVSPDILGLSAGAACGAALAMTVSWIPLQPAAFLTAVLAAALCYFMAMRRRSVSALSLVLAGIIVNGIFTAALTLIQVANDPFKLQTIVHWTMGNLHNAGWGKLQSVALPVLAGSVILFLFRWRLDVLVLGEEECRAVGLHPEREKILFLLAAILSSAAAAAVAGIIGLVGLAVPHMGRMLVGPGHQRLMPVSFLLGGVFLVVVDTFARSVALFEIPVGVFTTLVCAPFFIVLLKRATAAFGEG